MLSWRVLIVSVRKLWDFHERDLDALRFDRKVGKTTKSGSFGMLCTCSGALCKFSCWVSLTKKIRQRKANDAFALDETHQIKKWSNVNSRILCRDDISTVIIVRIKTLTFFRYSRWVFLSREYPHIHHLSFLTWLSWWWQKLHHSSEKPIWTDSWKPFCGNCK